MYELRWEKVSHNNVCTKSSNVNILGHGCTITCVTGVRRMMRTCADVINKMTTGHTGNARTLRLEINVEMDTNMCF